jgi:hypothetical protein
MTDNVDIDSNLAVHFPRRNFIRNHMFRDIIHSVGWEMILG